MPVMGLAVRSFITLTMAETAAPILICRPPINAEALPAFREKGAKESAEVFGNTNPWQHKKIKMNATQR